MWSQITKLALAFGSLAAVIVWALWRSDAPRNRATVGVGPVLKALCLVSATISLAGWLGLVASVNLQHTAPDEMAGRVYPWNNHGIVYLTKEERSTVQVFEGAFFLGWAVGLGSGCVIALRRSRSDNRKYVRPQGPGRS